MNLRYELPAARPGQAIGLLGGSFDPPHEGHLHISKEALKRFGLHGVWWLVSPGNPLKVRGPAPLDRRMTAAQSLVDDPRIQVTDIEAQIGTRYTAQTISAMQKLYPRTHFVWLMGADNLAQFHRWDNWQQIIERVPLGVLARPGGRIPARTSKAAQLYRSYRVRKRDAFGLAYQEAPAWSFVNVPMRDDSSSAIRARGAW